MKVQRLAAEFFAVGRETEASSDPAALHRLRVAAKRLRYALEILDPPGAKPRLARLRQLQEALGDMNDAHVACRFLRTLPALSAKARPLPARLEAEVQTQIAKYRQLWGRYFGKRGESAWMKWAGGVTEQAK